MTYSWPLSTWPLIWIMLYIINILYIHIILIIWLHLPSVQNSTPNNVLKPKNMTCTIGIFWSFLSIPVKENSSKSFSGRSRYDSLAPATWIHAKQIRFHHQQSLSNNQKNPHWCQLNLLEVQCSRRVLFHFDLALKAPNNPPKLNQNYAWASTSSCCAVGFRPVDTRGYHTGQFRHHPSAYPTIIVWKVVGQHLILNIIPNKFTFRTRHKVWCDWDVMGWSH